MNTPVKINKARTFATQSAEAKLAIRRKNFENTILSLRVAFNTKRNTTLFGICDSLSIKPIGDDRQVSKEELTQLVLRARAEFEQRLVAPVVQIVVPASQPDTQVTSVQKLGDTELDDEGDATLELPELTDGKKNGIRSFGFQVRKTRELLHKLYIKKHRATMLLSGTGTGKTFMLGALIAAAIRRGEFASYAGLFPVLYITKASVVDQTKDVLFDMFKISPSNVMITNIEQLRSNIGRIFLKDETVITQGQEYILYKWHKASLPQLVIWDEAHILKNIDSTQSRIAQALNDCSVLTHGEKATNLRQVFSSATPFMRLADTKCFAVATHADVGD